MTSHIRRARQHRWSPTCAAAQTKHLSKGLVSKDTNVNTSKTVQSALPGV